MGCRRCPEGIDIRDCLDIIYNNGGYAIKRPRILHFCVQLQIKRSRRFLRGTAIMAARNSLHPARFENRAFGRPAPILTYTPRESVRQAAPNAIAALALCQPFAAHPR